MKCVTVLYVLTLGISVSATEYISVGENSVTVNVKENVTLKCTGYNETLDFYIKNRVSWFFTDVKGKRTQLTKGYTAIAFRSFESGHYYTNGYGEVGASGFIFDLEIRKVTSQDAGIYSCTIHSDQFQLLDSKNITMIVHKPVEKLRMRLTDPSGNFVARSRVVNRETPVDVKPGLYEVKCEANGSNPEPDITLFYNERVYTAAVISKKHTGPAGVSYHGSISVNRLELLPYPGIQTLVCKSNIPGRHFKASEAGLKLRIPLDIVAFACGDMTKAADNTNSTVKCNVTASSGTRLTCDKVNWVFIDGDGRVSSSHTDGSFVITTCELDTSSMQASLSIENELTAMDVKIQIYLAYGEGKYASKVLVRCHEKATQSGTTSSNSMVDTVSSVSAVQTMVFQILSTVSLIVHLI